MLLRCLSIDTASVTNDMDLKDRTAAINRFNDPNSKCKVFLSTYELAAHGLNLQYSCSRMVLMESPINYAKKLHAIGRMHRLGQKSPQKVWDIFQDSTIQRWMEGNNTRKLRPQIAAQNRVEFEKAADARHQERESQGIRSIDPQAEREEDLSSLCDGFIRKMMGQEEGCADRNLMVNETDLDIISDQTTGSHHSRRFGQGINNISRAEKRGFESEIDAEGQNAKRVKV